MVRFIILCMIVVMFVSCGNGTSRSLPTPEDFTEVCTSIKCPDEESIISRLRLGYKDFTISGTTYMDTSSVVSHVDGMEVYRPLFTADYNYAVVLITSGYKDKIPCFTLLQLFTSTQQGWEKVGLYDGKLHINYDCKN